MRWQWPPRKGEVTQGNVFFLFVALVATVLLATIVAQQTTHGTWRPFAASFSEIRPELAALLPAGARYDEGSLAEIPSLDAGAPSYVVAYLDGVSTGVALVRWENREGAYVLASTAAVPESAGMFSEPPSVTATQLGHGLPFAVLLRNEAGSAATVIAVLIADDAGIRMAADAVFSYPVGYVKEPLELYDLSGNGVRDLLVHDPADHDMVQVFEWQRDAFVYSERLSWAVVMSKQLFPEPPAAAATGN